ncbi:hypothetical protein pb186bvf_003386 [Paramecium bursaria]
MQSNISPKDLPKHNIERFSQFIDIEILGKKGFRLPDGAEFLFDKLGGWTDEFGCHYDQDGNADGWIVETNQYDNQGRKRNAEKNDLADFDFTDWVQQKNDKIFKTEQPPQKIEQPVNVKNAIYQYYVADDVALKKQFVQYVKSISLDQKEFLYSAGIMTVKCAQNPILEKDLEISKDVIIKKK